MTNTLDSRVLKLDDIVTKKHLRVPTYQRDYKWDQESVEHFVRDLIQFADKYMSMQNRSDELLFFGTVILCPLEHQSLEKDKDFKLGHRPDSFYDLVDGQQRLTTLMMFTIVLDYILCTLYSELKKFETKSSQKSIGDIKRLVTSEIEQLKPFWCTKPHEPRIIRADQDIWSSSVNDYNNSLSKLAATLAGLDSEERPPCLEEHINKFEWISWINDVLEEKFLDLQELYLKSQPQAWLEETWQRDRSCFDLLNEQVGTENETLFAKVFAYLSIAKTVLNDAFMVRIEAPTEEWALEVFQSLNTTGTRLNVWETYRPRLNPLQDKRTGRGIAINNVEIKTSDFFKSFNKKQDKVVEEVFELLPLYHSGIEKGRKFLAQNRWLIAQHSQRSAPGKTYDIIDSLSEVVDFQRKIWSQLSNHTKADIAKLDSKLSNDEEGLIALKFLYDSRHVKVKGPLAVFYTMAQDSSYKTFSYDDFNSCVKAFAGFFTLYGLMATTKRLPETYRQLMSDFLNADYRWRNASHENPYTPKKLKDFLRSRFLEAHDLPKVNYSVAWLREASKLANYNRMNKTVMRFALHIAFNDTGFVLDQNNQVQLDQTILKPNARTMLSVDRWTHPQAKMRMTLEHVAPQEPGAGATWDSSIYTNGLVHHIGNITLLPKDINSSAGNKPLLQKLDFYTKLSSSKKSDIKSALKSVGKQSSQKTIDLVNKNQLFHLEEFQLIQAGSLSWDSQSIESRGQQILTLVWKKCWDEWLKP